MEKHNYGIFLLDKETDKYKLHMKNLTKIAATSMSKMLNKGMEKTKLFFAMPENQKLPEQLKIPFIYDK